MQEVDPDFVLPLYKAEGKGVFWYNSIFTGYVFRLTLTLAARVDEEMQHLGLTSSPFVGVQIRRGDACGQTRPCMDIDMYSDAVVRMCEAYGISLVYLATDDPHALPELQEALHLHSTSIKVVGQRLDRQFMASNTEQCGPLANEGIGGNNPGMGCEWIEHKLQRASLTEKLARSFDYLSRVRALEIYYEVTLSYFCRSNLEVLSLTLKFLLAPMPSWEHSPRH
jgi:hypothetical protein